MASKSGRVPDGQELREFQKGVFKLKTEIANLQRRAARIGTKTDSAEARQTCSALIRKLHEECNRLKVSQEQLRVKELAWDEELRESYRRTCRDLAAQLKACKDVADFCKLQLQQHPQLARAKTPGGFAAAAGGLRSAAGMESLPAEMTQQRQQQQVMGGQRKQLAEQSEVDYMSSVVDERSEQITDILEDVNELNQLMTEMAQEVQEQGFQLDQFNENLEDVAADVETGISDLTTAARRQRRSNRWCCWSLIAAVLFLAALVVALLKLT